MHELSIAQALAEQVLSIAEKEQAEVTTVTVLIGALSGVEPAPLEQAYRLTAEDSPLRNSTLIIEREPATIKCHSCQKASTPTYPFLACQSCGSMDFEITAGRDMILKSVELRTNGT